MIDLTYLQYAVLFDYLTNMLSETSSFERWSEIRRQFQMHHYPNDIRLSIHEMLMNRWREIRAANYKPIVKPRISMRNNMDFVFAYKAE